MGYLLGGESRIRRVERRPYRPWRDAVDADATLYEFHRQRLGERVDGALGGRIIGKLLRPCKAARAGAVDSRPRAALVSAGCVTRLQRFPSGVRGGEREFLTLELRLQHRYLGRVLAI